MLHTDIQLSAVKPDASDYAAAGVAVAFDMRTQQGRDDTRLMLNMLAGEPKREFVGPPNCRRTADLNKAMMDIDAAIKAGIGLRGRR